MTYWNELKRKAESKKAEGFELVHNLSCDQILALIADNERLSGECEGCPMSIAADLAKECDQLKAEIDRLNAYLKWEQNRVERISTHGPGCESWGPSHYECLLRDKDQLRAEVEALRKDAARYRWLRSPAAWNGFQLVMEKGGDNLDAAIDAVMSREGNDA